MKKLFFLLLVVNLVIWLWGQREELRRATGTAQPDFGAIRVIDEAELAARRQEAPTTALVAPPSPAAPADVEQRVATEPAEPVRTAAAARQLAEADAAAPPESAAPARPDAEATAAGPAVTSAAPEPAASTEAQAPVTAAVESLPPAVTETVAESTAVSPEPSAPEAAAAIAQPAAPETEAAEAPATPLTDDAAEPPADGTPSVPSAEVAASTPGTAPMAPDAAAPQPVVPEQPAPVEVAQADSVEAGAPAEALPRAEVIAPAEPVAPGEPAVATEAPAATREVLYLCESLGPFRDRTAAERIQESLQPPLRGVALREERIARTSRYWVLAPVQPDRQALAEYIARLEQAGVRDAWRIPSGPFAGRLAVGVFQSAANARKHADMLEAQGVAGEVHAPKDEERRYWIDYERPADADAPERAAVRSRPPLQIVPRDCGRVAGP